MNQMLDVNTSRNVSNRLKEKYNKTISDTNSDMYFHLPILSTVASRCNSVLELGVRDIQSTWGFLTGLAKESFGQAILVNERKIAFGISKQLVSIDIEDPAIHGADINEVKEIANENDVDFHFIQGDTLTVDIPNRMFDAIFFDTDHTYEQLSAELERYAPYCTTWMVFHDIARFGKVLIPAVNEWLEKNPEWIIVPNFSTNECNGLLVIAKTTVESWEGYTKEVYSDRYMKPL